MSLTLLLVLCQPANAGLGESLEQVRELRQLRMGKDAPPVPADAYARADQGTPVSGVYRPEGVDAGIGWGVVVYDQPIDRVWAAINNNAQMADVTPVSHSLVVQGEPCHSGRRAFEYLPISLFTDRWWIVELSHNAELFRASSERMWEMVWNDHNETPLTAEVAQVASGGMPVQWARGGWLLVDLGDGRTLAEYHTWTHPGGSLPVRMASSLAGSAVKKTIQAMGELAASMRSTTGFVKPDQSPL